MSIYDVNSIKTFSLPQVSKPSELGWSIHLIDLTTREVIELPCNVAFRWTDDVDPRLVEFAKKYDEVDIWPRAWLQVVIPCEFTEWLERHNIDVEHFLDQVLGKTEDESDFITYRTHFREEDTIRYHIAWIQYINFNLERRTIDVILSREFDALDDSELFEEARKELNELVKRVKKWRLHVELLHGLRLGIAVIPGGMGE